MFDENLARIRTHRNNIYRYQRLLRTELADLERGGRVRRSDCRDIPGDVSPCERFPEGNLKHGAGGVSGIRELLIRGSEKVIGHYRRLLASAKNEEERELYRSRIERERRLLDELHGGFPDRFAA